MGLPIEGARHLPTQHISVRVPWHDSAWDGTVCQHPRENTSCLALSRISGGRRDDEEESDGVRSERLSVLTEKQHPPCVGERVSFMAPFDLHRTMNHPYKLTTKETHGHFGPTPYTHPAYSAACVPFGWMLKKHVEGDDGLAKRYELPYDVDAEPELPFDSSWVQERSNQLLMLDTFFSAIQPDESLCFYYAKRTPLSEDARRVIIGVGRVKRVDGHVEYERESEGKLRCVLWERNVHHSIRANRADGFLLPYHEVLERIGDMDATPYVAFAPEDHWDAYSYGSAHVSHDAAIASLLSIAKVLGRLGEVVPGPWPALIDWVDTELNRMWKMRGPFPGFGSVLTAAGFANGTLIAQDIASALADSGSEYDEDPFKLLEAALDDPTLLKKEAVSGLDKTQRDAWANLKKDPVRAPLIRLLARMALTDDQAKRYFQPTETKKHGIEVSEAELLANPYRIYELDRLQPDAIPLGVVDRGLFPEPIIIERHPLPEPSKMEGAIDPRRVRAFVIRDLERATALGHTLKPRDWVVQAIRDDDVKPRCPVGPETIALAEEIFDGEVDRVETASGGMAYQLRSLGACGALIRRSINKRIRGKRHAASYDWAEQVARGLDTDAEEPSGDELRARQEKTLALEEIFASRISVLVGPAGTGKTTLLKMLCQLPEVADKGVLLLAPTGKARVRLEQGTGLSGRGQTLAQFLHRHGGRYEGSTNTYRVTGSSDKANAYKTVIIDECSMLTEPMLAATLDALSGVRRLVLVGDPRQLPPIGAGRPLLDIATRLAPPDVQTKFPRVGPGYAELTVRRRQRGAHRDDLLLADWFSGRTLDAGADEVWDRVLANESEHIRFVTWGGSEELQKKLIAQLVEDLGLENDEDQVGFEASIGGKPTDDRRVAFFGCDYNKATGSGRLADAWQIISPVRAHLHGVDATNRSIQERFRRNARKWATPPPDKPWRRKTLKPLGRGQILYGDKVINVRNKEGRSHYPKIEDARSYVANGEVGVVVGQFKGGKIRSPWKLEVELSTQLGRKFDFWPSEFGEDSDEPLELAYALTVHKTQGSEFGHTFVVLPNPCWLLSRELLYTALTRHKDKVTVFHQGDPRMLRDLSDAKRSDLAQRLTNLFDKPDPRLHEGAFLEDRLIHRTVRGDLVRSKSEVAVADILHRLSVDEYAYEAPLPGADGSVRYPDFTVEDAETGLTVYIEHLGMLHHDEYRRRWERKLEWYRAQDILPHEEGGGDNGTLAVTRDDERGGIDVPAIEAYLREVLDLEDDDDD